MTQKKETALLIAKLAKSTHKPVLPVFMGCAEVSSGLTVLHQHNIPNFEYCERAVRSLEKMYLAKRIKTEIVLPKYPEKNKKLKVNTSKLQIRTIEAEKILTAYNIPLQHSILLRSREEIKNICRWPVAMKIASRDIIHKKNSQALEININTPGQAESAFDRIVKNVRTNFKKAEIEGVLIQDMALQKHEEVIIGMKRDSIFGPLIMFGLGGSFVEVLKDVSFRLAPLNRQQALQQIAEIKSAIMLAEYDTKFLADLLIKISHLALDYPQIKELDLNPVFVYKKGGSVIDVRMIL
jgi:acetyltransferase